MNALHGKIAGPFMGMPSVQAISEEYGQIRAAYQADVCLYGTITTNAPYANDIILEYLSTHLIIGAEFLGQCYSPSIPYTFKRPKK